MSIKMESCFLGLVVCGCFLLGCSCLCCLFAEQVLSAFSVLFWLFFPVLLLLVFVVVVGFVGFVVLACGAGGAGDFGGLSAVICP